MVPTILLDIAGGYTDVGDKGQVWLSETRTFTKTVPKIDCFVYRHTFPIL